MLFTCILVPQAQAQAFPGEDVAESLNMTVEGHFQIVPDPEIGLGLPPLSDMFVAGNYAYIGGYAGNVYVIDITNPREMTLAASVAVPGRALDVKVDGDLLAVGVGQGGETGLVLVDISTPASPTVLSKISEDGWHGVHNLYLYNDRAYLAHGSSGGVTIVDISDPDNPVVSGHWDNETDGYSNSVHDIFIHDGVAFVSDFFSGLVILDLQDPDVPVVMSTISVPEGVHNAWQEGDYVYFNQEMRNWAATLHVANVADPERPIDVGVAHADAPPFREVMGAHNVWAGEGLLLWSFYDAGLRVFDLSAPDLPVEMGYHTAPINWGAQLHDDGLIYAVDSWRGSLFALRFHRPSHAIRRVELDHDVGVQGRIESLQVTAQTTPMPGGAEGGIARVSVRVFGPSTESRTLSDEGDGSFAGRLPIPAALPSGRHHLQTLMEDEQGRFYPFNVPFTLLPGDDLLILRVDTDQGWRLRSPDDFIVSIFDDLPALLLPREIDVALFAPSPLDLFGYDMLRLTFHPGDVAGAVTNNLRLTFDSPPNTIDTNGPSDVATFELYSFREDAPVIDMDRGEWQTVDVPLMANGVYSLPDVIESINLRGRLRGTSYLASIELIANPPSPDTAVREQRTGAVPGTFSLRQNYPNPFNPETTIRFDLPQSQEIELAIYNLAAQRVATLVQGHREAGSYSVQWDGRSDAGHELASGVYFYRLAAGEQVETRKLLLLR
jgi:hypothetical protein